MHFFDQHESACKAQWIIRNESQQTAIENAGFAGFTDSVEIMEGCNPIQIEDTVVNLETDLLDTPWARNDKEPIPSE
jgi:hypothetical protein